MIDIANSQTHSRFCLERNKAIEEQFYCSTYSRRGFRRGASFTSALILALQHDIKAVTIALPSHQQGTTSRQHHCNGFQGSVYLRRRECVSASLEIKFFLEAECRHSRASRHDVCKKGGTRTVEDERGGEAPPQSPLSRHRSRVLLALPVPKQK